MNKMNLLLTSLCCLITGISFGQYQYPFQNPDLPVEDRIDNLLSLMTLDEKVTCLGTDPGVPRLGVKGTRHVEGLHGLAMGGPSNWGRRNPAPTTIFPQAIGLAESWDRDVLKKVAAIEGYEVRYMFQSPEYRRGGLVVRAPNADLGRDPRWGRTEECYGEDAWYNAQLVVSFVKGLQGDDPHYWQTASLMKHFLANSNENGRDSTSSDFSTRLWREYYSYPFYKGVTIGGSQAYMAAYNRYNGIPCTVHPMLKEITVDEWGQNGIICTDGGAYRQLVSSHKYFPDLNLAAAACVKAGINQFLDNYREGVNGALANGYLQEADIDTVLRGIYRVMIKLGQLDPPEMVPYSAIGITDTIEPWLTKAHQEAALEVTKKTIVLLKNETRLLPLKADELRSVAVIGPLADSVLLDWYSGTPPYRVTPLEGIRKRAGEDIRVAYTPDNRFNRAVETAASTDVAIVVVGNHPTGNDDWALCPVPSDGKEGVDRKTIMLEQEELVKRVYEANPNTIVVLVSSFPFAINWSKENIPAIVHMTHCSQETGNALAEVLFGDYNPAGRLVQTWPASINQLPPMMDYDITRGRTYMYMKEEPLFEFGYGLSYTTFQYSDFRLSDQVLNSEGEITAFVDVTNTGHMTGDEVVQLYIRHVNSEVTRPNIELKGFERVKVMPGETKTVSIPLKAAGMAYWDEAKHGFVVEEDKIEVMVGSSSRNIKYKKTIEVKRTGD
ncbi:MAG: glycoside hydrolase family 3 C-terminal domain-containing protein [Bacteroidales bacterium]|nr:glycoside hydrolase family 3 C-terminal domain-containing protein [Bacteroidales bacterium]